MSRRYTITEPAFTLSATTMSLVQLNGASGKVLQVLRWWWRPTDNTLATAQVLYTRCRLLPATVTNGAGGNASPSITANDGGDASVAATARTRDTSYATTNGTARLYDVAGAHIYNGYDQQIQEGITVKSGEAFVFELVSSAVLNAPNITVGVEFEEIG
jgi:hypothetical protein